MNPLVVRARDFAHAAHEGVVRKYTGDPYFVHVERVADAVGDVPGADLSMVSAAYLHDVVEDTDYELADIDENFGADVASLVSELTNVSKKELPTSNRAQRKAMDLDRLSGVSRRAKIIKMIDRTDNLRDMHGAQGGFKRKYIDESTELLDAIGSADETLAYNMAMAIRELEEGL